jgi:nucleoside 2-deoxyribosyltransferase
MNEICLVGDILLDVSLKTEHTKLKMRLGGIVHAARGLWALGIKFSIGYFSPNYLDEHIKFYLNELGCQKYIKLGTYLKCPNIMLIKEVKEIGDQGYEFLFHEHTDLEYDHSSLTQLAEYKKIFLISGNYDINFILSLITDNSKIYIDIANNIKDLNQIKQKNKFETIYISTSSEIFNAFYKKGSFVITSFFSLFKDMTNTVIFKENRGGSRAFSFLNDQLYYIPSQNQEVVHSVGVGDVYDVANLTLAKSMPFVNSLYYASWIAAEYATTTYPDDFKKMVKRCISIPIDNIIKMGGCSLPWEIREDCHIYIAAPDFDHINSKPIDYLVSCLMYHNFQPHRPIKENGQMKNEDSLAQKNEFYSKDMELLNRCHVLIAVLLYNDPGTLVEIGIASERKMPVILYDPYNIATNCMLTQSSDIVTSDMDTIISTVFSLFNKIKN